MDAVCKDNLLTLKFDMNESIVLFEWIESMLDDEAIDDNLTKQIIQDLGCVLEKEIPDVLNSDYKEILAKARDALAKRNNVLPAHGDTEERPHTIDLPAAE